MFSAPLAQRLMYALGGHNLATATAFVHSLARFEEDAESQAT